MKTKPSGRNSLLAVRLTENAMKKLEAIAHKHDMNKAQFVRQLINEYAPKFNPNENGTFL